MTMKPFAVTSKDGRVVIINYIGNGWQGNYQPTPKSTTVQSLCIKDKNIAIAWAEKVLNDYQDYNEKDNHYNAQE